MSDNGDATSSLNCQNRDIYPPNTSITTGQAKGSLIWQNEGTSLPSSTSIRTSEEDDDVVRFCLLWLLFWVLESKLLRIYVLGVTVIGQAQGTRTPWIPPKGKISEEEKALLLLMDGDKIKRKMVMRKTKSSVALHCLPLTQYVSRRISDMGWDWRDADPITLKQKVTLISPPNVCQKTSAEDGDEEIDEGKRRLRADAKSVAILTNNVMFNASAPKLEGVLSKKAFEILNGSAFRCIARVVFCIFDMEDFERIHDFHKFLNEYVAFSSGLDSKKSVAEQEVESNKCAILRENDIFCALKNFHEFPDEAWHERGLLDYCAGLVLTDSADPDIEMAERAIQSCAPLKRDKKMQLILEMMFEKRYLVYDTLVLRALRVMVIGLSYNEDAVRSAPDYELEAAGTLARFVYGVVYALWCLMEMKSSELNRLQEALLFPIVGDGIFGPCKEEVLEVIRFADFERRLQNLHTISSKELLFCLSLTRVGSCVKTLFEEKSSFPELSIFMLYKCAREEAAKSGDKYMTLDHLVMAFYAGEHKIVEQTSISDDKVLDENAWDGELWERLNVSGYERGDVKMWNSFSKPSRGSMDPMMFEYSFNCLVSRLLDKSNYRVYDYEKYD